MSIAESFEADLAAELRSASLPTDVREIIGRAYRFGFEGGSHHVILVGTITSVEVSDEGGLVLHVTSPRIRGDTLVLLRFNERRGWAALGKSTMPGVQNPLELYPGELALL